MSEARSLEPIHVARALKKIVETSDVQAVFLGKQAIDDDANQTGALLAGQFVEPQLFCEGDFLQVCFSGLRLCMLPRLKSMERPSRSPGKSMEDWTLSRWI